VLSVHKRTTHHVPLRVVDRHVTTTMVITAILSKQPFAVRSRETVPHSREFGGPVRGRVPHLGENLGDEPRLFRFPGPSAWARLLRTTQVDTDSSTRSKYGARVEFCMSSFFSEPLASTLDDGSVGFSTRCDDPSNREFSSIDNDR
jgi:hypothetical protein